MKLTSGERYLVDTNVLVYSVNKGSPFYVSSRQIIEEALLEGARLAVAHQNLIEFIAVLTRGYKIAEREALKDAGIFASQFDLIYPLYTTLQTYMSLARKLVYKAYPFDLYLVATMKDNGVDRIITANAKDFGGTGLKEIIQVSLKK